MVVFFSLSGVITAVLLVLAVIVGQLGLFFEWIANNKETVVLITGIIVLIKVIVFMYRNDGMDRKIAILLLCPVVHIPFVKFLFLLSYNILNPEGGQIWQLMAIFGRVIVATLMLLYILWTDCVFFKHKDVFGEEHTIGGYLFHIIGSIVFSVLTILIYANF